MDSKTVIPRPEYPRPDFERSEWLNLNGEWEFEFDDGNRGEAEQWFMGKEFSKKIIVPFCFQSKASGINDCGRHEILWYRREFVLPESFKGKRVQLNFGAVDYFAKVWINGQYIGEHYGGHVPFKVDLSVFLKSGTNQIVVRVEDSNECMQPRGKQYWGDKPDRCWYTPTSGIWQTVWLETVGEVAIERIRMTPDIDRRNLLVEIFLDKTPSGLGIHLTIGFKGRPKQEITAGIYERVSKFTVEMTEEDYVDEVHYWTPENPNLYDIELELLQEDKTVDSVKSYFGMRKISIKGDLILLNNKPYYQRLVLDQGYWPETLLTPPSDEALVYDIEMAKKFGFNGVRKHQKIEDPRYYYWADRMGMLVWGEMPSGYNFNIEEMANITREWREFINRDYNHPSIITWVPLNESWGVRNILIDKNQQNFAKGLYYLTKALDGTRLVSTNDGWEQPETDICGIHDYVAKGEDFIAKYEHKDELLKRDAQGRLLFCEGSKYAGQPILISEYGGIAFESGSDGDWGYHGAVKDEEEFFQRYAGVTLAIQRTSYICGYCYTQLTDVEQEVNGLLSAERKIKINPERVKQINLEI